MAQRRVRQYHPPKELREAVVRRGMELADRVDVDMLDMKHGMTRTATTKTAEEILQIALAGTAHWTLIERALGIMDTYWDLGVSTLSGAGPDYFIWVRLSPPVAESIIKEFDLQER